MCVGFPRSPDGTMGHTEMPLCEKLKSHM